MVKVVLAGIDGKMGKFIAEAIQLEQGLELVAGVEKVASFTGDIPIYNDLFTMLEEIEFDVYVDVTIYEFAKVATQEVLKHGKAVVIGTTGFNKQDIDELKIIAKEFGGCGVIAPNFSIGAILINKFTEMCTRYFKDFEIVEYHHVNKIDKPSGTAIYMANTLDCSLKRKISSTHIHSIRMPGILAKHQVLVSDENQVLELTHQSNNRHSFEQGIIFAIHHVMDLDELIYGLQSLLV